MNDLPNPFNSAVPQAVESAVVSPVNAPGTVDAAAEPFDGPDIPLTELVNRGFNPERFFEAIEPLPFFLQVHLDRMAGLAAR